MIDFLQKYDISTSFAIIFLTLFAYGVFVLVLVKKRNKLHVFLHKESVALVILVASALLPLFAFGLFRFAEALVIGNSADVRNVGLVLIGIAGAPFVAWRSWLAHRQSETVLRQTDISEQGQITDRFNRAIEALGAERILKQPLYDNEGVLVGHEEKSVANTEVRIGGLYALERIAQDSGRDHIQIMKVICAYVRNNAGPIGEVPSEPDAESSVSIANSAGTDLHRELQEAWRTWRAKVRQPDDIRIALEILSSRTPKQRGLECSKSKDIPSDILDLNKYLDPKIKAFLKMHPADWKRFTPNGMTWYSPTNNWAKKARESREYKLDLRGSDLRGADLSKLALEFVQFEGTLLQGANFYETFLVGSGFQRTNL